MYHVYVLYSKPFDWIYIGQTSNLQQRIIEHNSGKCKSTKHYIPLEIVYNEEFATRAEAMKREMELKSHQGRDFIRREILSR